MKIKNRVVVKVLLSIIVVLIGVGILVDSQEIARGIKDGLLICGNVLIPALFPFMVLSGFISRTDYAKILSIPLTPITTKLYKLPSELGVVVLLSMIGGYPVGPSMVSNLLNEKAIDKKTAERMICFCTNCGPSFMISAVGVGMLMNKNAGIILMITQTLATLLIGTSISYGIREIPLLPIKRNRQRGASAFVSAVSGASSSMIIMCAFATIFSGLIALIKSNGAVDYASKALLLDKYVVNAIMSGVLEVTAGSVAAAKVGGVFGFALISIFVSLGGLSVIFQVASCFEGNRINFSQFIVSRLLHAICAVAMAVPLYKIFCDTNMAWVSSYPPLMYKDDKTWIISICLISMSTILILQNGKNIH